MRRPPLCATASPPVLCFVGPSGVGKTTLLEQLIARFARAGVRVAAIKHDAHEFEMDREGKDSFRLRRAGACAVAISSRTQAAFLVSPPRPLPLAELVRRVPIDVDLILVEGHKQSDAPKIELHRRGCDLEDTFACTHLGRLLFDGQVDVAPDRTGGSAALERACGLGEPDGCITLARRLEPDNPASARHNYAEARRMLDTDCRAGIVSSCRRLADLLWDRAMSVSESERNAELEEYDRLMDRACQAGDAGACVTRSFSLPPAEGRAVRDRLCRKGDGPACGLLANDLEFELEHGGPASLAGETLELRRRACNLRYWEACNRLGVQHGRGDHVAQDLLEARLLYDRACGNGHAQACVNLSTLEGPHSLRERDLLVMACDGGNASGCLRLAEIQVDLPDGVCDSPGAIRLLERARRTSSRFTRDGAQAASWLGLLHLRGRAGCLRIDRPAPEHHQPRRRRSGCWRHAASR